jgi:hypothetical protein
LKVEHTSQLQTYPAAAGQLHTSLHLNMYVQTCFNATEHRRPATHLLRQRRWCCCCRVCCQAHRLLQAEHHQPSHVITTAAAKTPALPLRYCTRFISRHTRTCPCNSNVSMQ